MSIQIHNSHTRIRMT